MAIGGLVLAALCAGALGWVGHPVLVLLPDSEDAGPQTPSNREISRAPRLCWWLAGTAAALIVIVTTSVPLFVLPAWILVCGVGTWLAYIDWRTRLLPASVIAILWSAAVFVLLLEAWLASDLGILLKALASSAAAYGLFWLLWLVSEKRRPDSFGFGDVRFAAPLGLVLGSVGFEAALAGFGCFVVVGAIVAIIRRVREQSADFALGPAMLAGSVLGLLIT